MATVDWIVGEEFEIVEWKLEDDRVRIELLDGRSMWQPEIAKPVVAIELTVSRSESLEADLRSLEAEGVWAIGQEVADSGPVIVFEGEGWSRRVPCRHVAVERLELGKPHFVRIVRGLRQQLDSLQKDARASRETVARTKAFLLKSLDRAQRVLDGIATQDHPARQRAVARVRCLQEALNVLES